MKQSVENAIDCVRSTEFVPSWVADLFEATAAALEKAEKEVSDLKDSVEEHKEHIQSLKMGEVNLLYGSDCRIEEPWTPSVADTLIHPLDQRFASQPWNRRDN